MPTATPTPTPTFTPIPSGLPVQKVFVLRGSSPTEVRIDQYSTTKLNIMDTLSFDNVSFDVSNQAKLPTGIFTDQNGSNCFVVDSNVNFGTGRVYKYTLSTPWDLATISYSGQSLDVSVNPEDEYDTINPSDVAFGLSGTRLYVLDNSNNELYAYDLSVAYDLSTATYLNKLSLNQKPERPYDAITLAFDISGDNLYVLDAYDQTVEQFELGTSWDISTAVFATEFRVRASNVYGLSFNSEGTRMFIDLGFAFIGYRIDTPWDISTASLISFSGGSLGGRVSSISLRNSELGNVTPTPTATDTPTISLTPSVTPSVSVSATATPTPTVSPSAGLTPTPAATVTPTVTPTSSADVTPTVTPTITASITPTPTAGITPTPSVTTTVTPSISPSANVTPTPTSSVTPTVTPASTLTPTPTFTSTAAVTSTPATTVTPTNTITPTTTVTPTVTPTPSAFGGPQDAFVAVNTDMNSFPFSSPFTIANSVGTLSASRISAAAISEREVQGFIAGGQSTLFDIVSFPFAAPFTTDTDLGDLSSGRGFNMGQSSDINGYSSGGRNPPAVFLNNVDRFPFGTSFTTSTDIGNLVTGRSFGAGTNSSTDGYTMGGQTSPVARTNTIDRFPFSTPFATATDVGNLSENISGTSGQFSDVDGYRSAGVRNPFPNPIAYSDNLDRFPFSAPFTSATNLGSLRRFFVSGAGNSSSIDGHISGGYAAPTQSTNTSFSQDIDRFPFTAPSTPSVDVGNITSIVSRPTGHQ
jgi:hypothetical protein